MLIPATRQAASVGLNFTMLQSATRKASLMGVNHTMFQSATRISAIVGLNTRLTPLSSQVRSFNHSKNLQRRSKDLGKLPTEVKVNIDLKRIDANVFIQIMNAYKENQKELMLTSPKPLSTFSKQCIETIDSISGMALIGCVLAWIITIILFIIDMV